MMKTALDPVLRGDQATPCDGRAPKTRRHQPKNWFSAQVLPYDVKPTFNATQLVRATKVQIVTCMLISFCLKKKALVPRPWEPMLLELGPQRSLCSAHVQADRRRAEVE